MCSELIRLTPTPTATSPILKGQTEETDMTLTRTFDEWRDLANCNVMWRVTDDQAERAVLLDKIAAKCCELERRGEIAQA